MGQSPTRRGGGSESQGTVENAIQHTQSTALKGRKFESIDEQNTWLAHWEERWAAPRIHGRKKRQVLAMFAEEKPALKALPVTRFRYFRETSHTVDDSGLVQVLRSYYAAIPASPGTSSRCASTSMTSKLWMLPASCCAGIRDP